MFVCPSDPRAVERTGSEVGGSHSGRRPPNLCAEAWNESVSGGSGPDRLPAGQNGNTTQHVNVM